MSILDRTLAHIGETGTPVLAWAQVDGEVVVVLDKGIQGCPKYRVPLSLIPEPAPEPGPEPEGDEYVCAGCGRVFDTERGVLTHARYCTAGDEEE
jgi:hypothetical protein